MNEQSNIYLPHLMVIEKITHEAPGVKTFRLKFKDEKEGEAFHFKAGQFGEYSAFGEGSQLSVLLRRLLVKDISSVHSVRQDG